MLFSIIIPTLNEAAGIQACLLPLQPLRQQCEIIIADGGSTDRTRILAFPLADHIVMSPPGRARQMNCGAAKASGDILIFLHADTCLPDNALVSIQQQMQASGKAWGRFDLSLDSRHYLLKLVAHMINWRSRLTGIASGDQAIFVTRPAFFESQQYPEIELMEDIALSHTLHIICPPLCIKAKVISSARRWEQNGIIKTILLMWLLRIRYYLGTDPAKLAQLYRSGTLWKT